MPDRHLETRYPLLHWYLNSARETGHPFPESRYRSMRELLRSDRVIAPGAEGFLACGLHDSRVLGLDEFPGCVCLRLDDFSTHCFCDAVAHAHGLAHANPRPVMPVTLTFHGVSACRFYRLDRNFELVPTNKQTDRATLSEYLYDEVSRLDETGIAVAIVFWRSSVQRHPYVILEVEAKALQIEEQFRDAFVAVAGEMHEELFGAYMIERKQGNVFDFSGAVDFLNRIAKQYVRVHQSEQNANA